MKLAARMKNLGTETAFETLAKAKALEAEGKDIVHLEIGEPDFDTPENIINAAKLGLDQGYTHYGPSPGLPHVRAKIAEHQSETHGFNVSPDHVVITPGAKPIMFFSIMALIESGDEVIYPNPGFPIYESMINFMGGKAAPLQLREENDFNADIQDFKNLVNKNTKLIILNSPNNPCGSVIPKEELGEISEIIKNSNAIVLTDEVYKNFYFEGQHSSISEFEGMKERTIILDGFSKSFAMTGWRLGYGVFPEKLVEPISRLITNSVSCTSSFSQIAAIEAIDGPQDSVLNMVDEFKARRQLIVEGLNSINGISCRNPKGAFYAFPNIKETGYSSKEITDKLLFDYGVALLSGTAFGKFGEGYLRLSFANTRENLNEAIKRIKSFLN